MNAPNITRVAGEIQTLDTDDVLAMLACTKADTWLARVLLDEVKSRGVDRNGQWIGHARAAEIWK